MNRSLSPAIRDLLEGKRESLHATGDLLSSEQLQNFYSCFRRKFGPDILSGLEGEELLMTIHNMRDRDSLVYWLEFKNDEEFPGIFGSIAGGSALKFGIFLSKKTGSWMTGGPQSQREISQGEAIGIAEKQRTQLVTACGLLQDLPPNVSDEGYGKLQEELALAAPDVQNTAWGHKYLSLLFPDKLDDYHVEYFQEFHLVKLLQSPPPGSGRYRCAGRFVEIANETGWPMNHLTTILNRLNPRPYSFWRISTSLGDSQGSWSKMRDKGMAAIGWSGINDLSELDHSRNSKLKIVDLLNQAYDLDPPVASRTASEIMNFCFRMSEPDVVIAMDGGKVLGIGRVSSPYSYTPHELPEAPHQRSVDWADIGEWDLPVAEGLQTTFVQIKKNVQNLLAIEDRLMNPSGPPSHGGSKDKRLEPLSGIPGRAEAILKRKGQVILYGPPGTGKTYWARRTAIELVARSRGKTPEMLSDVERDECTGNDERPGQFRFCTFHPAYGYEDFIEGYRPYENDSSQLLYRLVGGIFKEICSDASQNPKLDYVLLVDEINRGEIPRIFGELLTLLEKDKRGMSVRLPVSGESFSVPPNVFLIGTMNTADRSIALLDTALRRRFGFIELMPDAEMLGDTVVEGIPLGPWLSSINERILEFIGRDARNLQIGHAYLLSDGNPIRDLKTLASVLAEDIVPLIQEYCYEDYPTLTSVLGKGMVDEVRQRIRMELFDPERQADLISALLAPCPEILETPEAIAGSTELESEGEEDGELGESV